jgi:ubiquinone/menaquinone biosynthesis C-methylase UbiE
MNHYIKSNQQLWEEWAQFHPDTAFYNMEAFLKGATSLMPPELEALGEVSGKSLLHLQCHFGQDSLSWTRKGAKVTGVDFSEKAIEFAQSLNAQLGLDATFLQSNVLELNGKLDQQFDIVFTSYGVLTWLNDLKKWAEVVWQHLKPGGTFYIVEFHPGMMMFDFDSGKYDYSYFFEEEPYKETASGSYADPNEGGQRVEYNWQHSLAEVAESLLNTGLQLKSFREYNWSPYDCFPNMEMISEQRYQVKSLRGAPHLFAFKFERPA